MSPQNLLTVLLAFISAVLLLVLIRQKGKKEIPRETESLMHLGKHLEQLNHLVRQVDEMSRVFHSPRLRGGLGEKLMEDLIRNYLPLDSYTFQYRFSGGQKADAVIRLGSWKVVVDAKFPLEQLQGIWDYPDGELPSKINRIFLNHGRSIAEKYILPREGTLSFALMYIPSENLYYRVFVAPGGQLPEELLSLGILPVGPSGLFAYLQTVAYGLKGLNFSSRSKEMMHLVSQIRKEFSFFARQMQIAEGHLKNFNALWSESRSRIQALDENIRTLECRRDS